MRALGHIDALEDSPEKMQLLKLAHDSVHRTR